eukprot:SAG11_NODE_2879_length_2876_cov_1.398632_3_plen_621_part_00
MKKSVAEKMAVLKAQLDEKDEDIEQLTQQRDNALHAVVQVQQQLDLKMQEMDMLVTQTTEDGGDSEISALQELLKERDNQIASLRQQLENAMSTIKRNPRSNPVSEPDENIDEDSGDDKDETDDEEELDEDDDQDEDGEDNDAEEHEDEDLVEMLNAVNSKLTIVDDDPGLNKPEEGTAFYDPRLATRAFFKAAKQSEPGAMELMKFIAYRHIAHGKTVLGGGDLTEELLVRILDFFKSAENFDSAKASEVNALKDDVKHMRRHLILVAKLDDLQATRIESMADQRVAFNSIWEAMFAGQPQAWDEIGFHLDPGSDFSLVGLLGLKCFNYFVQNYTRDAENICAEYKANTKKTFPVGEAVSTAAEWVYGVMSDKTLLKNLGKLELEKEAVFELFCAVMFRLIQAWKIQKPLTAGFAAFSDECLGKLTNEYQVGGVRVLTELPTEGLDVQTVNRMHSETGSISTAGPNVSQGSAPIFQPKARRGSIFGGSKAKKEEIAAQKAAFTEALRTNSQLAEAEDDSDDEEDHVRVTFKTKGSLGILFKAEKDHGNAVITVDGTEPGTAAAKKMINCEGLILIQVDDLDVRKKTYKVAMKAIGSHWKANPSVTLTFKKPGGSFPSEK